MRKSLVLVAIIAVVGAYWMWPYLGAFAIAEAAKRGDAGAVAARVDFPALRRSLAHQLIHAYLALSGRGDKMGALGRGMALAVGSTVADPYLTDLLNPDTLTGLIGKGHLASVKVDNRTIALDHSLPALPDLLGSDLATLVVSSYYDGLQSFVLHAGGNDGDYGIHLHLSGFTWQVSGVDLPRSLVDRIVADILAKEKADKQS